MSNPRGEHLVGGLNLQGPETVACHRDLEALCGHTVLSSKWVAVTQDKIDGFASLTGDEQWIHTDPDMAAEGMFGKTIAQGDLTLALTNVLLMGCMQFGDYVSLVRQRLDVHFIKPVYEGSRLGLRAKVLSPKRLRGQFDGHSSFDVQLSYLQDLPNLPPSCEALASFLLQWS